MIELTISEAGFALADLRAIHDGPVRLTLDAAARQRIAASAATVEAIVASGKTVYGINTGFGLLASERIGDEDLAQLQKNLILSHCSGVGEFMPDEWVRLMMSLKVMSLSAGVSGVRLEVIDTLLALLAHEIYPCVPAKGSVGASGDLAPLAHMSAVLMGVGEVRRGGHIMTAAEGLSMAGVPPVELAPKEGLALINGTQASTAMALSGLFKTLRVFGAALVAGGMSIDALKGSDTPFDPRIHAVRGHAGQKDVAGVLRQLIAGSDIRNSHVDCSRVQDPYSLRCQPQVMGAALDAIRFAAQTLTVEANAVTDNPLVFSDPAEALSGGNFHAEPVAFAADLLAMVLCEIGNLSERRLSILVDPKMSGGLPAFLVKDGGLNSGFMIPQVTAAALASENKGLAHPASVDTIPTSANQEDHVSMAAHGARRLWDMAWNTATIVGIEVLAAAQGLDFHRPLKSSAPLEAAHAAIREQVEHYDQDRYWADDLERGAALVRSGALLPDIDWPAPLDCLKA